jgi:MerR family transcriptional regulator, light-induced transcriptional regulator
MSRADQEYMLEYLRAVIDKDGGRAKKVIDRMLDQDCGMLEVFEVLAGAQFEIGDLWERGVISVADEHFATKTTLESIEIVSQRLNRIRPRGRGLALLCTVEGEYHEVGLRMFSELLRNRGWETVLLGSSFSASAITDRARAIKGGIDLLCISATMQSGVPLLLETLRRLRIEPIYEKTKIVVGGAVFKSKRNRLLLSESVAGKKLADHVSWKHDAALDFTSSLGKND